MLKKWITWYALLMHLIWGMLLMFWSSPLGATPIFTIAKVLSFDQYIVGAIFIFVALLAMFGLWLDSGQVERHDVLVVALLIPQQIVLLMNAGGAVGAVLNRAYADGVDRHFAFILADQTPIILAAIIYSLAIIEHFSRPSKWTILSGSRLQL